MNYYEQCKCGCYTDHAPCYNCLESQLQQVQAESKHLRELIHEQGIKVKEYENNPTVQRNKELQTENEALRANSFIQEHIIESNRNPKDKEKIVILIMENKALRAHIANLNKCIDNYTESVQPLINVFDKVDSVLRGSKNG